MKKNIIKAISFVVIVWGVHYLTIISTPYAILVILKLKSGASYNTPVYTDVVTDKERRVVMPNPDFLYTAAGYNLSKGPVRISGKMPKDSYFSLAFYQMNTRNFFVKSDRESPDKKYEVILATAEQKKTLGATDIQVIESPGKYGAMLVRILVTEKSQVSYLQEIQHSIRIQELAAGGS